MSYSGDYYYLSASVTIIGLLWWKDTDFLNVSGRRKLNHQSTISSFDKWEYILWLYRPLTNVTCHWNILKVTADRITLAKSVKPPCAIGKNTAILMGLVGVALCLVRSCGHGLYFLLVERKWLYLTVFTASPEVGRKTGLKEFVMILSYTW